MNVNLFNRIQKKEVIEFARVFSLLLYSRISVIQALEIIIKQTKNKNLKEILKKILKDVKAGVSLSKSFSKYPVIFPEIFIANLRVGEETGQTAEVIGEFSSFQEKIQDLKKKIAQAIRYPALVLVVAVGVIVFMLMFIIPAFEGLFTSVKAELPDITKFLVLMSTFFSNNSSIIMLLLLTAPILFFYTLKSESFRKTFLDGMLIKTPYISTLYLNNLMAQFSLSMGILLKSRVSVVESLKISKNISQNHLFKQQIDLLLKRTVKGESLSQNLNKLTFFDVTFSRLLAVGEESAELDKVFYQMSNYYSNEFDHNLDTVTALLEPMMIILVGGIVGFILVGLYLPMFEIINYFGV